MSWSGGASSWYSRRGGPVASSEDEQSWVEDDDEVTLEQDDPRAPSAPSSTAFHASHGFGIMSKATYESVKEIFTPAHEVKKKTGELLLKARGRGEYKLFAGVDLDADILEHAGYLPADASPSERTRYAKQLEEQSCDTRCGDECKGDCLVRAFVHVPTHGTDYYFGSGEEVARSVLTEGSDCEVYIWDELEQTSMDKLYRMLDSVLQMCPGLAMRTTELKTVPGQVLHHCDVAAWIQFCLEHPDAKPQLRFHRLQGIDSSGNAERKYGAPCTSLWQEEMEALNFPNGLPDGVDLVGCMHAFDVSDLQSDGSRKSGNFYGAPAGLSNRGDPDVWPPIAFLPRWQHPDTDAGRSRWRRLMRECLDILFACYDGQTYIKWRAPNGEERVGLLALMSLVVDGGDYPWLTNTRGPKGLFNCGRCRIAASLIHTNVTQLWRWRQLRRTYKQEVGDLQTARAMRRKEDREHFTQVCGLNADAVDNPLYGYFGSLYQRDWVAARRLAVERLHTIETGVCEQVQLLMIQLPQRLYEPPEDIPKADSPAAAFADRVLLQSAASLHRLVAAVPPGSRHSTWPVATVTRLLTRFRGKQKPPTPLIEFHFCNGWHHRDLGRVMAVWVLQPSFFGAGLQGPAAEPALQVLDFASHEQFSAGPAELGPLMAEVWCLLACWYSLFLNSVLSDRDLQDLRILDDEFHEAAKGILHFKATWKKHQMEEAPESRRDLGDQISANLSEAAHKLTKLLYTLCTNRSLTTFSQQLVSARNRIVAAQLYCRQYKRSLQPVGDSPAPQQPRRFQASCLVQPQRKRTLELVVDARLRVTSLRSSCGAAQQSEAMLLDTQGYKHLFWAILNYLNESGYAPAEEDGRGWPLTTLRVHSSILIAQTECPRTVAAPKVTVDAFAEVPTHAFVRVNAGERDWFGQPILAATVSTADGARYEVVYCKWLEHELTGVERLKLPLPTSFPMHQWAKTHMGLPPQNGRLHPASDSYGVVDASKILNWEPIVSIGVRTWRPTSDYLGGGPRGKRKRGKDRRAEQEPAGVGEPLFANNIHAWSFGSSR